MPHGFPSWEGWGKEFSGVAKLLGLDAQSVPVLRIQCVETLATFQGLLPSTTQLLRCQRCEWALPQHPHGIVGVARPIPRLDPCSGIESKITKARAFHGRACAPKRILALLLKLPGDHRYSRLITIAVRDWLRHTFQENLKFPRRAELAGNPF